MSHFISSNRKRWQRRDWWFSLQIVSVAAFLLNCTSLRRAASLAGIVGVYGAGRVDPVAMEWHHRHVVAETSFSSPSLSQDPPSSLSAFGGFYSPAKGGGSERGELRRSDSSASVVGENDEEEEEVVGPADGRVEFVGVAEMPDIESDDESDVKMEEQYQGGASALIYRDNRRYDFIVVGGGSTGLPLSAGLAGLFELPRSDSNIPKQRREDDVWTLPTVSTCLTPPCPNVLVLERGHDWKDVPSTHWFSTQGLSTRDPNAQETFVTPQGVLVQNGKVLGGGSSVSLGLMQREDEQYFSDLRRQFGVDIDFGDISKAYDIGVRIGAASPVHQVPNSESWSEAVARAYEGAQFGDRVSASSFQLLRGVFAGYDLWDAPALLPVSPPTSPPPPPPPPNGSTSQPPFTFVSSGEPQQRRVSSAVYVERQNTANLNVQVDSEVEKLLFTQDPQTGELVAQCVVYRVSQQRNQNIHHRSVNTRVQSASSSTSAFSSSGRSRHLVFGDNESQTSSYDAAALSGVFSGFFGSISSGLSSLSALFAGMLGGASGWPRGAQSSWPANRRRTVLRKACLENSHANQTGRIVLSAGAAWTPAVLFRSGIGPRALLEQRGIQVLLDVPLLGQGLVDKPVVSTASFFSKAHNRSLLSMLNRYSAANYFDVSVKPPAPCHPDPLYPSCHFIGVTSYKSGHSAESTTTANRSLLPPLLRPSSLFDSLFALFSSCPVQKDTLTYADCSVAAPYVQCQRQTSVFEHVLTYPHSRGEVTLDPSGRPSVNFNYFSDPRDMVNMKAGVRKLMQVVDSLSLSPYLAGVEQKECEALYAPSSAFSTIHLLTDAEVRQRAYEDTQSGGGVEQEVVDMLLGTQKSRRRRLGSEKDGSRMVFREGSSGNAFYPRFPVGETRDGELELLIKAHYTSSHAYGGSAAMNSVVGTECELLGPIANVDIADASILPQLPRVSVTATLQAMGLYCAHRILAKWKS